MIMKVRIRRQSTMSTKNAKMNKISIAFDPFNRHEFPWVQHTVMTDTNGADKKIMYCEVSVFFSGHWIWDPGH